MSRSGPSKNGWVPPEPGEAQEEILAKIDEQGKLTPDLRKAIENAQKLTELEDYYLPYKQNGVPVPNRLGKKAWNLWPPPSSSSGTRREMP